MVEGPIWAALSKGKARKKIAKYSFSVIYFNEPQFSGPTTSEKFCSHIEKQETEQENLVHASPPTSGFLLCSTYSQDV